QSMVEDVQHGGPLRQTLEKAAQSILPPGMGPMVAASAATKPAPLLRGWAEILEALGRKNNKSTRRSVKRLNESYGGPIKCAGQGTRPLVNKNELLPWWNRLDQLHEEQQQEQKQERANIKTTVEEQHNYGRDGKVVPNLAGHMKKKRKTGQ